MATQVAGAGPAAPMARTFALIALLGGCGSPTAADAVPVEGTLLRGPIQPVCQVEASCDGPLVADFTVVRNDRVVVRSRTDGSGRFSIALPPGSYEVVPAAGAPIMWAGGASQTLTVVAPETRGVTLHFDTGIR